MESEKDTNWGANVCIECIQNKVYFKCCARHCVGIKGY